MKFVLGQVRFICVQKSVRTKDIAASLVQKMYDAEYGPKSARVFWKVASELTPNESRLIDALQSRFAPSSGPMNPIIVTCGENDYVFIAGGPMDGFYVPIEDCLFPL